MTNSTSPNAIGPATLPLLALPYPSILYPRLVLSLHLSQDETIALLRSALESSSSSNPASSSGSGRQSIASLAMPLLGKALGAGGSHHKDGANVLLACVPVASPPASSSPSSETERGVANEVSSPGTAVVLHDGGSKDGQQDAPGLAGKDLRKEDLTGWGCAARLTRIVKASTSPHLTIVLTGLYRIRIDAIEHSSPSSQTSSNVLPLLPRASITSFPELPLPSRPPRSSARDEEGSVEALKAASIELLALLGSPPLLALPAELLKKLRAFVEGIKENQAGVLADVVAGTLGPGEWTARVELLSQWKVKERVTSLISVLRETNEALKASRQLSQTVSSSLNSNQRETLLRQQLQSMISQLAAVSPRVRAALPASSYPTSPNSRSLSPSRISRGPLPGFFPPGVRGPGARSGPSSEDDEEEEDEEEDELAELKRRVASAPLSEEARRAAERELKRLGRIPPQSVERGVIMSYLEWIVDLPWERTSLDALQDARDATSEEGKKAGATDEEDLVARARRILDEDHYGLDKIKRRLVEYLAVLGLKMEQAAEAEAAEEAAERKRLARDVGEEKKKEEVLQRAGGTKSLGQGKKEKGKEKEREGLKGPFDELLEEEERERKDKERSKRKRVTVADKGPILLLVGPPGTGKTSIARSLATALRRKFHRISLGGVRDEAEIRGHRRTYVGAMPGAIVQGLRKVGVNDPVFLLDEIDKLNAFSGYHGDPSAAMLEVLDPEQNHAFNDHYINVPIDLSRVLFIATANTLDTIPEPLLDRTEVIRVSGYSWDEKLAIARKYLLPKQVRAQGLKPEHVVMGDDVILQIATAYTREAGVRSLEREIGAVVRSKAVEFAETRHKGREARVGMEKEGGEGERRTYDPKVTVEDLERILGIEKFEPEVAETEARPGIATGLAYQGSGNGGILHIESILMPGGSGSLKLTGSLGDVISESATLGLSWVKAHAFELGITESKEAEFPKNDIHLHLPSGAIPKDGPSAGVAMVLSLVSLFTKRSLPTTLAATGEITLRGNVTPVGGIKEKVLGAHRAGIKRVLLPERNHKDVAADLPKSVAEELEIVYVRSIWQALEAAFGVELFEGLLARRDEVGRGKDREREVGRRRPGGQGEARL